MLLGVVLVLISVFGLFIIAMVTEDDMATIYWALGIMTTIGMVIIMTNLPNRTIDYSLKEYNVEIEVQQKIINGQEISIDTVYIFTPKKK